MKNKALEYAKSSLEMEGFKVSKEQEQLVLDALENKITHDEFISKALELAHKINPHN
ncbi:antitoxin VbhA family protein [Bacillus sp. FSL K6-3431]|uniref:antitoxin VbhA family protein n=1 Tax=Bacillus sp. FSL K6-3431 TaxID=2921500 RepID=UPI0030F6E1F7